MKTLIIYSSKYGVTKDCSNLILKKLEGNVDILDIKKISKIDLNQYDNILIGTPVYMGMINKNIVNFCNINLEILSRKRVFIFVCGMSGQDKAIESVEGSLSQGLFKYSVPKYYLGGKIDIEKMGFFDKLIIKIVSNVIKDSKQEFKSGILLENIQKIVDDVNNNVKV